MPKTLYIISGCNGAGKTTASFTILPDLLGCKEFINADEIAKGLSPFQPEKVAFEAGRIMLKRLDELIELGKTFAFETTLASKIYKGKIEIAKAKGFKITLLFFWLSSVELAKERVKTRVKEGGHNIEAEVIERRYKNGIKNLFELYLPIVDELLIIDNSSDHLEYLAQKTNNGEINIINFEKFQKLSENYERYKK